LKHHLLMMIIVIRATTASNRETLKIPIASWRYILMIDKSDHVKIRGLKMRRSMTMSVAMDVVLKMGNQNTFETA